MDRRELLSSIRSAAAQRDLEVAVRADWLTVSAPVEDAVRKLPALELLRANLVGGVGKYWRDVAGTQTAVLAQVPVDALMANLGLVNCLPGLDGCLAPGDETGLELPSDPVGMAAAAAEQAGLAIISSDRDSVIGQANELAWRAEVELRVGEGELSVWCPLVTWPSAAGHSDPDPAVARYLLSLGRAVRVVAPTLRDAGSPGSEDPELGWALAVPLPCASLPLAVAAAAAACSASLRFHTEARVLIEDASVAQALRQAYQSVT